MRDLCLQLVNERLAEVGGLDRGVGSKSRASRSAVRLVLMTLAARARLIAGRYQCFPSIASIAADTGASQSVVYRALAQLEAEGLICREDGGGGRTTTTYTLCVYSTSRMSHPAKEPAEGAGCKPRAEARSARCSGAGSAVGADRGPLSVPTPGTEKGNGDPPPNPPRPTIGRSGSGQAGGGVSLGSKPDEAVRACRAVLDEAPEERRLRASDRARFAAAARITPGYIRFLIVRSYERGIDDPARFIASRLDQPELEWESFEEYELEQRATRERLEAGRARAREIRRAEHDEAEARERRANEKRAAVARLIEALPTEAVRSVVDRAIDDLGTRKLRATMRAMSTFEAAVSLVILDRVVEGLAAIAHGDIEHEDQASNPAVR